MCYRHVRSRHLPEPEIDGNMFGRDDQREEGVDVACVK
jgi:hypothetical protein